MKAVRGADATEADENKRNGEKCSAVSFRFLRS